MLYTLRETPHGHSIGIVHCSVVLIPLHNIPITENKLSHMTLTDNMTEMSLIFPLRKMKRFHLIQISEAKKQSACMESTSVLVVVVGGVFVFSNGHGKAIPLLYYLKPKSAKLNTFSSTD